MAVRSWISKLRSSDHPTRDYTFALPRSGEVCQLIHSSGVLEVITGLRLAWSLYFPPQILCLCLVESLKCSTFCSAAVPFWACTVRNSLGRACVLHG